MLSKLNIETVRAQNELITFSASVAPILIALLDLLKLVGKNTEEAVVLYVLINGCLIGLLLGH